MTQPERYIVEAKYSLLKKVVKVIKDYFTKTQKKGD